jgi:hypothetical protein
LFFHLQGFVPHLKTLKILGGPSKFDTEDVPLQQKLHAPNLECLQAASAISISQFVGSAGSLRELNVLVHNEIHNIQNISSFPLLQALKIECRPWDSITIQPFLISLPQLITLTLAGDIEVLLPLQLDFLALQSLNITNIRELRELPQLSPLHVNWEGGNHTAIERAIKAILRMSSKILTLTVQVPQARSAWKIVKRYQSEGHIPEFTHLRVNVGKKVVDIEDLGALRIAIR